MFHKSRNDEKYRLLSAMLAPDVIRIAGYPRVAIGVRISKKNVGSRCNGYAIYKGDITQRFPVGVGIARE